MEIKVLWLDDEFDSEALKSTFIRMEKHFRLIKCYTKEEFFAKIESEDWDAIVLDVLDKNGRDSGFRAAAMRIMTKFKDTPWFVFSGQTDVIKKESDIRSMLEEEDCQRDYADIIYIKSEHNDKLIEDIKNAVCNKPEWQARNSVKSKYREVLSVFDVIGNVSKESFFEILMSIEGYKEIDHKIYYTQLRIVLEWMFRHANNIGLLHDKCVVGKVNLTESSLFLAGEPTKYLKVKCAKQHFPKLIADNVKSLLFITGGASHTTEQDEKSIINLQDYWDSTKSPYLLYSQTLILCDILLWYKKYSVANSCKVSNEALWKDIVEIVEESEADNILKGKITNVLENGLAFLKPNGSTNLSENCSVNQKCRECRNIDVGDELKVEFEEKENRDGNKIRVATKILEHKPKTEE